MAASAGPGSPPRAIRGLAARTVSRLYGRESSFLILHTNEFCGKSEVDREARNTKPTLKVGRWAYERGAPKEEVPEAAQALRGARRSLGRRKPAGRPPRETETLKQLYRISKTSTVRPSVQTESPGLVRGGLVVVVDAHEAGRYGGTAYWVCLEADGGQPPIGRRMGSVGDWPMATSTTEQREVAPGGGRRMAEAPRKALPLGLPGCTAHWGAVRRTGPWGTWRGKADAQTAPKAWPEALRGRALGHHQ